MQQGGQAEGMVVRFGSSPRGTAIPGLPWRGSTAFPTTPIDDRNVLLYYGVTLDPLDPIPAEAPERASFIHDIVVPDGHYWIMGDNRQSVRQGSEDSRVFGTVRSITIVGRATAVIWPPQREGEWNWRRLVPPLAFADVPGLNSE